MTTLGRIRLLRAVLPAALLVFLAVVFVSLRERPSAHRPPVDIAQSANGRSGEGFELLHLDGDRTALDARAGLVEERPPGGYHLENIERLAVSRADRGPLVVEKARVADVSGPAGERRIHVEGEVVVFDAEAGLRLSLPWIEVDEVAGIAESTGAVEFTGQGVSGRAAGVRYHLRDEPSELAQPTFEDATGGRARADIALLHDGVRDLELRGSVRGERGVERFDAGRVRVWRGENERPRRAVLQESVSAHVRTADEQYADLAARSLEASWDAEGRPERARLDGTASLARQDQTLSADTIEAVWDERARLWDVDAAGEVYLRAVVSGVEAWLSAERLDAQADRGFALRRAHVEGHVRFESDRARAEADSAEFEPTLGGGAIRLTAREPRKARLARDRTRIAADQITTDPHGSTLVAEGRVEATLLPSHDAGKPPPIAGLFLVDDAVHFVARSLRSEAAGARVFLRTGVRGWQAERNLSADEVDLDQTARRLTARGHVTTRIPRDAAGGSAEEDFVQVTAERLDYDERDRVGVYSGGVRASLNEGWLEAGRVEVHVGSSGGIEQILAQHAVRIEFRSAGTGQSEDVHVGTGDRLEYIPGERTVRLFGDDAPATVRRLGRPAATTTGRVLRYHLDLGTLEVEPGPRSPARIRGG